MNIGDVVIPFIELNASGIDDMKCFNYISNAQSVESSTSASSDNESKSIFLNLPPYSEENVFLTR